MLRYLRSQQRGIASLAVTVLMANGLVVASRSLGPELDGGSFVSAPEDDPSTPIDESTQVPEGSTVRDDGTIVAPDGTVYVIDEDGNVTIKRPGKKPVIKPPVRPGPVVQGVTDNTIEVVYYWKGERTQSSPYIEGTPAEGANLDEAMAFRAYVEFINKHANDGTEFFGVPINLHGRRLVYDIVAPPDAGSGEDAYAPLAERIAAEIKPFAAVASHGSISTYFCPRLAETGIFNLQTYDLGGMDHRTGREASLYERTDGFCTPAGLTWDRQIDLTIGYLKQQMLTPTKKVPGQTRVYGVIYTTYKGLDDVGDAMVQRLRDAGIPIAASARLPVGLTSGQTDAQQALAKMRDKNVNTLIMPDAGSPLVITHAAQAQQFYPDYYVWPCSGLDVTGMVRLFNAAQWEGGAEGMTCYDRQFNPDVANNNWSRNSEWWKAYQEMRPGKEPPAPSPLVYAGLYQLVAGLSHAGRNLTPETFKAGLDEVPTYRYDTIDGVTEDPTNMLLTMSSSDRSMIGDAGTLVWNTTRSEGGPQGAYVYGDTRYRTRADF
jgi:hypothetical protein